MGKKVEKDFLDELVHFTIHENDLKQLPKNLQDFVWEYHDIEMYHNGLKRGKKFDKVAEAKRLIKEYCKVIRKNKGQESNEECMIISQLTELINRMMAYQIRELRLDKLLDE
jgi:hypothetical protein